MSEQPVTPPADEPKPPNVHQAMARAMNLVRPVGKWGENKEQGYSFRSIDHFMTALNPAMAAAGVHVVPRVLQRITDDTHQTRGGTIMRWVDVEMEFTFYGPDGSSVKAVTWGEARDAADKATNKAMTGAFKYAIMQAFMVPTQDLQDADAEHPESVPGESQEQRQAREAAEAAQLEADRQRTDADDATVQGLRGDALRAWHGFQGHVREAKLRRLWEDARSVGALGCVVALPPGWVSGDTTETTLDRFLQGAARTQVNPGEDPDADNPATPPVMTGEVTRSTEKMENDPWATQQSGEQTAQQSDEPTPGRDPEEVLRAAQARARAERKGAKA